mmetsp:Transcript_9183/g.21297  ORF Transcript_9183/g.21297 Transcript_9183/m.21297 type:complete len:114 (-) Transcript_9183:666-1007(-)
MRGVSLLLAALTVGAQGQADLENFDCGCECQQDAVSEPAGLYFNQPDLKGRVPVYADKSPKMCRQKASCPKGCKKDSLLQDIPCEICSFCKTTTNGQEVFTCAHCCETSSTIV